MRTTFRRLAAVRPSRYLEPGVATGLAGLYTHSSPRSTLLYLYSSTLDKLKAVPESSVYRQSVESLTKHRLALVDAVKPPGYEAWLAKAQKVLADSPERFNIVSAGRVDGARVARVERNGQAFLIQKVVEEKDIRYEEWDGEVNEGPELEGVRTEEERKDQVLLAERQPLEETDKVTWESEPPLTAEQIEELETKIGAGLIEEVIQVAEGELRLVDTMVEAKVWESLEEKPAEGQWVYFERKV